MATAARSLPRAGPGAAGDRHTSKRNGRRPSRTLHSAAVRRTSRIGSSRSFVGPSSPIHPPTAAIGAIASGGSPRLTGARLFLTPPRSSHRRHLRSTCLLCLHPRRTGRDPSSCFTDAGDDPRNPLGRRHSGRLPTIGTQAACQWSAGSGPWVVIEPAMTVVRIPHFRPDGQTGVGAPPWAAPTPVIGWRRLFPEPDDRHRWLCYVHVLQAPRLNGEAA